MSGWLQSFSAYRAQREWLKMTISKVSPDRSPSRELDSPQWLLVRWNLCSCDLMSWGLCSRFLRDVYPDSSLVVRSLRGVRVTEETFLGILCHLSCYQHPQRVVGCEGEIQSLRRNCGSFLILKWSLAWDLDFLSEMKYLVLTDSFLMAIDLRAWFAMSFLRRRSRGS